MAIVKIIFTDKDNGDLKVDFENGNIDSPSVTFAEIAGRLAYEKLESVMEEAIREHSAYERGLEIGRRLAKGINEDDIDEDELEIERQEEEFYNGPR